MIMIFEQVVWFQGIFQCFVDNVDKVVQGKQEIVGFVLVLMFVEGYVFFEDVLGIGKISFVKVFVVIVQGISVCIQFMLDLLLLDVMGVMIYDQQLYCFEFYKGLIFVLIVFVDEINCVLLKIQFVLFEVMEELWVMVDGVMYEIGCLFFVIVMQNLIEQVGMYKFFEVQFDWFLIKMLIGYFDFVVMESIFVGVLDCNFFVGLFVIIMISVVVDMVDFVVMVYVEFVVLCYVVEFVEVMCEDSVIWFGVLVCGVIVMICIVKVWVVVQGCYFVFLDDIKIFVCLVWQYCLLLDVEVEFVGMNSDIVIVCVFDVVLVLQV